MDNSILEKSYLVSEHWVNRLVRAEVDFDCLQIRFYGLRRAEWQTHRLLKTVKVQLHKKLDCD